MKKALIIIGIAAIIVAITSTIAIVFKEQLTDMGIIGGESEITNTITYEELNGIVIYDARQEK